MQQQSLTFETQSSWLPSAPPSLAGEHAVFLDTETTGLRWWGDDYLLGISVATRDGKSWYLPIRHAGGNLDEGAVRRWCIDQLAGKQCFFFNAPFDVNTLHKFGVDLEAMGCQVSDIGHYAALLDERRTSYKLDSIAKSYLGHGKVKGLDVKRLRFYHAGDVEKYAREDVRLLVELERVFVPMIVAEDLERVLYLEDDLIYVSCAMMREGAPIDEEKLDRWIKETNEQIVQLVWDLYKETGIRVEPTSPASLRRVFAHFGIPFPQGDTKSGVSFNRANLRTIDHPTIKKLYHARILMSLQSKFLLPYKEEIRRNGLLRYSLHQMPMDDEGGTVSGRYSSSSFATEPREGKNIQQVAGKKWANVVRGTPLAKYNVRELFIPRHGLWLSADAEQIEYRLFAHYAKPPAVLAAYQKDPRTDFHNFVWDLVRIVDPEVTRELTKDLNFAKIYGAGIAKIAAMLHMPEDKVRRFVEAYDQAFPEAKTVLNFAKKIAEKRGWVKTLLGRRSRFPNREFTHKALNRIIQGSAADEMKLKLLALHEARKETQFTLRFPVHDEVNGDIPDKEHAEKVRSILDRQILPTRVPLLWGVEIGVNWAKAKKVSKKADEPKTDHEAAEDTRARLGQEPSRKAAQRLAEDRRGR